MSRVRTRSDNRSSGAMLVQKMFELESAYRDINDRDREVVRQRGRRVESGTSRSALTDYDQDEQRDREITKLKYMVNRLEERLKISKVEMDASKRELKNEQEGRQVVEKKLKALEKENKDLRNKMSTLRVKLGVVNANYNVGKHETDELKKNHQDNQIQIARLEERLSAANQELERLRNPLNPDGSEEMKRKISSDKKELKTLRVELKRLEELQTTEEQRLADKDEEIKRLQEDIERYRTIIANLQNSLEIAEMDVQAERASREDFEMQNRQLRSVKENFDEQIKEYKVKLGITKASKNVNVRQAELLKKKDEEYQYTVQTLEKRLREANAEIERLNSRYMETGKTAMSLQNHKSRLKKYRNTFNMEFLAPRSYDGVTGWTPTRLTPKGRNSVERRDRVSVNSVGSVDSLSGNQSTSALQDLKTGKRGRTSAP